MPWRDWVTALQIPLFTAVLLPALVGMAIALRGGFVPSLEIAVLAAVALVLLQAGANLQKGLVESRDLPGDTAAIQSIFIFDSGAVERVGWSHNALRALTALLVLAAGLLGGYVILLHGDLFLLAIGLVGGLLGFFYSAPPLKLSYRGIGEIATFISFGPLLVTGIAYLFTRSVPEDAILGGTLMGFLAALISYERYFPAAGSDARRGKRTPVVILGERRATLLLWTLMAAPYATAGISAIAVSAIYWPFLLSAPVAGLMIHAHLQGLIDPPAFGRAAGLSVALHLLGGLLLTMSYLLL